MKILIILSLLIMGVTLYGGKNVSRNGKRLFRSSKKVEVKKNGQYYFKKGEDAFDYDYPYQSNQEREKALMKAKNYYDKGCRLGSCESCYWLGRFYKYHKNKSKYYIEKRLYFRKAATCYEKACISGDPYSCNDLAVLYRYGDGVKKSETISYYYGEKSCKLGFGTACEGRAPSHEVQCKEVVDHVSKVILNDPKIKKLSRKALAKMKAGIAAKKTKSIKECIREFNQKTIYCVINGKTMADLGRCNMGKKRIKLKKNLPANLTKKQVLSVIKKAYPKIKNCGKKAGITGTVKVKFRVNGSGYVSNIVVPASAAGAKKCIHSEVKGMHFPQFSGSSFPINFPFKM